MKCTMARVVPAAAFSGLAVGAAGRAEGAWLAAGPVPAMGTLDEVARVGQRVRQVDVPAEEHLNTVPSRPVDKRLMVAGIPLTLVEGFADLGTVLQDLVD